LYVANTLSREHENIVLSNWYIQQPFAEQLHAYLCRPFSERWKLINWPRLPGNASACWEARIRPICGSDLYMRPCGTLHFCGFMLNTAACRFDTRLGVIDVEHTHTTQHDAEGSIYSTPVGNTGSASHLQCSHPCHFALFLRLPHDPPHLRRLSPSQEGQIAEVK